MRKLLLLAVLTTGGCSSTIITDNYSSEPFDPCAYNPKTVEEFNALPISNEDKWTWLIYRREEIGVCFEDEFLNGQGQCEIE